MADGGRGRFWVRAGLALGLVLGLGAHGAARYRIGIDPQARVSLDARVFLVDTGQGPETLRPGDRVAFRARGLAPQVPDGTLLVKRVAGVPGDWVRVTPAHTWINGQPPADGLALAPALGRDPAHFQRAERVPVEHLWVLGDAPDSYDSRYWGFLPQVQVVGRAHALF